MKTAGGEGGRQDIKATHRPRLPANLAYGLAGMIGHRTGLPVRRDQKSVLRWKAKHPPLDGTSGFLAAREGGGQSDANRGTDAGLTWPYMRRRQLGRQANVCGCMYIHRRPQTTAGRTAAGCRLGDHGEEQRKDA